jgi:hypothetical protein
MTNAEIQARLAKIDERLDWMANNLEGCDWCCGGGDEERSELVLEMTRLIRMLREKEAHASI